MKERLQFDNNEYLKSIKGIYQTDSVTKEANMKQTALQTLTSELTTILLEDNGKLLVNKLTIGTKSFDINTSKTFYDTIDHIVYQQRLGHNFSFRYLNNYLNTTYKDALPKPVQETIKSFKIRQGDVKFGNVKVTFNKENIKKLINTNYSYYYDCLTMQDFASHVISVADKNNMPITPLKLQKVMYFTLQRALRDDVLTVNQVRAFYDIPFQVWGYGPVIRPIYEKYRIHGAHNIVDEGNYHLEFSPLDTYISELLIVDAFELVEKSKKEDFWLNNQQYIVGWRSLIFYSTSEIENNKIRFNRKNS